VPSKYETERRNMSRSAAMVMESLRKLSCSHSRDSKTGGLTPSLKAARPSGTLRLRLLPP